MTLTNGETLLIQNKSNCAKIEVEHYKESKVVIILTSVILHWFPIDRKEYPINDGLEWVEYNMRKTIQFLGYKSTAHKAIFYNLSLQWTSFDDEWEDEKLGQTENIDHSDRKTVVVHNDEKARNIFHDKMFPDVGIHIFSTERVPEPSLLIGQLKPGSTTDICDDGFNSIGTDNLNFDALSSKRVESQLPADTQSADYRPKSSQKNTNDGPSSRNNSKLKSYSHDFSRSLQENIKIPITYSDKERNSSHFNDDIDNFLKNTTAQMQNLPDWGSDSQHSSGQKDIPHTRGFSEMWAGLNLAVIDQDHMKTDCNNFTQDLIEPFENPSLCMDPFSISRCISVKIKNVLTKKDDVRENEAELMKLKTKGNFESQKNQQFIGMKTLKIQNSKTFFRSPNYTGENEILNVTAPQRFIFCPNNEFQCKKESHKSNPSTGLPCKPEIYIFGVRNHPIFQSLQNHTCLGDVIFKNSVFHKDNLSAFTYESNLSDRLKEFSFEMTKESDFEPIKCRHSNITGRPLPHFAALYPLILRKISKFLKRFLIISKSSINIQNFIFLKNRNM